MAYYSQTDTKRILNIDDTETDNINLLTSLSGIVDSFLNDCLSIFDATVPLNPVPTSITNVATQMVVALFHLTNGNIEMFNVWYSNADMWLNAYLLKTYQATNKLKPNLIVATHPYTKPTTNTTT